MKQQNSCLLDVWTTNGKVHRRGEQGEAALCQGWDLESQGKPSSVARDGAVPATIREFLIKT